VLEVGLDFLDQVLIAVEMMCRDGAMDGLAVLAIVLCGDVGSNQFPLARRERMRASQQHLDELAERLCGLRAERHGAPYAWQVGRKRDVCHGRRLYGPQACRVDSGNQLAPPIDVRSSGQIDRWRIWSMEAAGYSARSAISGSMRVARRVGR
jgi:hypothetical protein